MYQKKESNANIGQEKMNCACATGKINSTSIQISIITGIIIIIIIICRRNPGQRHGHKHPAVKQGQQDCRGQIGAGIATKLPGIT